MESLSLSLSLSARPGLFYLCRVYIRSKVMSMDTRPYDLKTCFSLETGIDESGHNRPFACLVPFGFVLSGGDLL